MKTPGSRRWMVGLCALVVGFAASAQGKVIYVDDDDAVGGNDGSSWTDAYVCLQDALAIAKDGDEIRVAQGVYTPDRGAGLTPGDQEATFGLVSGVTLAAGYAGLSGAAPDARDIDRYETILSGDLNGDDGPDFANYEDNSYYGVVSSLGNDATTVLEGFTITGGNSEEGAGIRCLGSDTLIRKCRIVRNKAKDNGAGMVSESGSPVLSQCVFQENWVGRDGGGVWNAGHLVVEACSFRGNIAGSDKGGARSGSGSGGGLYHDAGNLSMRSCDFVGNSALHAGRRFSSRGRGGAIRLSVSSEEQIFMMDCLFRNNEAFSGGAIYGNPTVLRRCQFTGNIAYDRGGALEVQGELDCENCLFDGNHALGEAAAVRSYGALQFTHCTFVGNRSPDNRVFLAFYGRGPAVDVVFTNCIVWGGDAGLDLERAWPDHTRATYSNVQGGWPGEGNIDADPCFADPGLWDSRGTPDDSTDDLWIAGDYHLKSQAGRWDPIGETWMQDEMTSPSIDGGDPFAPIGDEPFPNGGIANMGAYSGTAEASKSYFGDPVCETHMAGDINGDCKVDVEDLLIVTAQWIGRPHGPVVVVEPADGAILQLGLSESFLIRAVVNEPGFVVRRMQFEITYRSENPNRVSTFPAQEGEDGWYGAWIWWNSEQVPPREGDHTITATATDVFGRTEVSEPVVITIHQAIQESRR